MTGTAITAVQNPAYRSAVSFFLLYIPGVLDVGVGHPFLILSPSTGYPSATLMTSPSVAFLNYKLSLSLYKRKLSLYKRNLSLYKRKLRL